ncbi:MAG: exo-alpha-sialidase [Lentisphaeria bacterium]|nr:exo-alpha-sialidase [Lentisphaeria bacterium]
MQKNIPLYEESSCVVVAGAESGYNSWPFLRAIGSRLVCVYSRGSEHSIEEPSRGVYARISDDAGKTWSPEVTVCNSPSGGEIAESTGSDRDGAMLLFVRFTGESSSHHLYRTCDGMNFEKIASPVLEPVPMQIMDIFHPRSGGLMALWFAGDYKKGVGCWGTLFSEDNGLSWRQRTVESGLPQAEWPTEHSAVIADDGRILVVARTEVRAPSPEIPRQFQLESADDGFSWRKSYTNISDIRASTPALLLDRTGGLLSNYYYERNAGILKRRTAQFDAVWRNPEAWPDWEAITTASTDDYHAGNVKAVECGDRHILAFYSGNRTRTAILTLSVPKPV